MYLIAKAFGLLFALNFFSVLTVFFISQNIPSIAGTFLLIGPVVTAVVLVITLSLIKEWEPFCTEVKKYWKTMPKEDKNELKRIIGQAAKVLLRHYARDERPQARFIRRVLEFAS